MGIESILNWAMPVAIVLFFIGLFYIKLKEPADIFLAWIGRGIKSVLSGGAEAAKDTVMSTEIQYG